MKNRNNIFLNFLTKFDAEKGITLVEMVISIVIVSLMVTSSMPFFKGNIQSYISVRDGKNLLQSARIGFGRMMAEMQQIAASVDIYSAYSTSIEFNIPDDAYGSITYRLYYGELQREGIKLIENVRNLTFTYFAENGSVKSTPFFYDSDIWRIQVELEVGESDNPLTLRGMISPRNIHYN